MLPLELIREVLFLLAMTSHRKARELRLVSSDVNVLVLPLLFRNIVITTPNDVYQLTTVLLPKRKYHIPALKSRFHVMPRPLATYNVESCVLVINDRRPSIEEALARIAPVFCSISKLAITARNLQAHGYWLRKHPIRPKIMVIVHYGSPHLFNYHDPIFENVTHLYTSTLYGHRSSTVIDLPSLTHLAVCTRPDLPEAIANSIVDSLCAILEECKTLQMLVLVMDFGSSFISDIRMPLWESRLDDFTSDNRFVFLPDFRAPRLEWEDIVRDSAPITSSAAGLDGPESFYDSVWKRAEGWRRVLKGLSDTPYTPEFFNKNVLHLAFLRQSHLRVIAGESFSNHHGPEWEIDLVERDNYEHPKASDPDLKCAGFQSAFG